MGNHRGPVGAYGPGQSNRFEWLALHTRLKGTPHL